MAGKNNDFALQVGPAIVGVLMVWGGCDAFSAVWSWLGLHGWGDFGKLILLCMSSAVLVAGFKILFGDSD